MTNHEARKGDRFILAVRQRWRDLGLRLDNVTRVKLGGAAARDRLYCYNAANRLEFVRTGATSLQQRLCSGLLPRQNKSVPFSALAL